MEKSQQHYQKKKKFGSKSVYNKKYLKTKIKSYNGKINTHFHSNTMLKEGSQWICLSVILIDSVCRKYKSYNLQVFLEKFVKFVRFVKNVVKEKKTSEFITDDIEISSDRESSNEGNSNEEI